MAPGTKPRRVTIEQPSLSGDRAAAAPTVEWAFAATLLALGIWLLARRWRKWWAYVLGAPLFLVVLFVFFENVARLLPANI